MKILARYIATPAPAENPLSFIKCSGNCVFAPSDNLYPSEEVCEVWHSDLKIEGCLKVFGLMKKPITTLVTSLKRAQGGKFLNSRIRQTRRFVRQLERIPAQLIQINFEIINKSPDAKNSVFLNQTHKTLSFVF